MDTTASNLKSNMDNLRKDLKADTENIRTAFKDAVDDLKGEMDSLRKDTKTNVDNLRNDLRDDIGTLKSDIDGVKSDLSKYTPYWVWIVLFGLLGIVYLAYSDYKYAAPTLAAYIVGIGGTAAAATGYYLYQRSKK